MGKKKKSDLLLNPKAYLNANGKMQFHCATMLFVDRQNRPLTLSELEKK